MSQEWEALWEKLAFSVRIELIIRQACLRATVGCLSRNLYSNHSQWYLQWISRGTRNVSPHGLYITTQAVWGSWETESSTPITGNWTKKDLWISYFKCHKKVGLSSCRSFGNMECFVQKQFYNYWWFERVWQLVLSVNLPQLKIIWVGSLNGRIILIDMEDPQKTWVPHSGSNPNKKGSHERRKTSKFLSLGVFSCHWINLFTLVLLMLLFLLHRVLHLY